MAFSKLATQRLTKLANFMDKLPHREHFDMGSWFQHRGKDHTHGFKRNKKLKPSDMHKCGTSACALGWATAIPSFNRAGLAIKVESVYGDTSEDTVRYGRREGTQAAEKFFDIGHEAANYLFVEVSASTPKQWARACRAFLKTVGPDAA